ncbi:MAG: GntR family transcriptional regulator [Anaerolineaceae bacterium]|nr:GntR family transcriptional regulator [Anaerolineaceae bacterium]
MRKSEALYVQVQNSLLEMIKSLKIGDKIPTESELVSQHGVSRITIRKAIENLVLEGLLEKKPGIGTTVCGSSTSQNSGRVYSWTEEMKRKNLKTSSSHLHIQIISPSPKQIQELHMTGKENLVRISRVRLVNGTPVAIIVNYVREKFISGFAEKGLSQDSLYRELEENYGLIMDSGEEVIKARLATSAEACLLEIPDGSAVLHVQRRTFIKNKTPVEIVDMIARGDKYQYFTKLEGGYKTRAFENGK